MDAVREITGSEQVGTVGLCAGGQLLAATMAHLRTSGDDRVAYAAFGVSQIDMSVPNVAGLALHPALNGAARVATEAAGVVDGRAIAAVFSWLRPNELVWNQWVNNYLMGVDPAAVRHPRLEQRHDPRVRRPPARPAGDRPEQPPGDPGGLTLLGTPVDLGRVTVDTYVVGAETDHLVPWQGAYRSTQLFGGDSTFVLSGGGHIQHLVNPPGQPQGALPDRPVTGRARGLALRRGQAAGHLVDALGGVGAGQVRRRASGTEDARQPAPPADRGGPGTLRDGAMIADSTHVIDGLRPGCRSAARARPCC